MNHKINQIIDDTKYDSLQLVGRIGVTEQHCHSHCQVNCHPHCKVNHVRFLLENESRVNFSHCYIQRNVKILLNWEPGRMCPLKQQSYNGAKCNYLTDFSASRKVPLGGKFHSFFPVAATNIELNCRQVSA